jgi:hypothetical protein
LIVDEIALLLQQTNQLQKSLYLMTGVAPWTRP